MCVRVCVISQPSHPNKWLQEILTLVIGKCNLWWVYAHKLFLMGIKIRLACVSWVDLLNAHTSSGVWHAHPLGIHKGARQYRYHGFTRHSHSRRHRQAVKTCFLFSLPWVGGKEERNIISFEIGHVCEFVDCSLKFSRPSSQPRFNN